MTVTREEEVWREAKPRRARDAKSRPKAIIIPYRRDALEAFWRELVEREGEDD